MLIYERYIEITQIYLFSKKFSIVLAEFIPKIFKII